MPALLPPVMLPLGLVLLTLPVGEPDPLLMPALADPLRRRSSALMRSLAFDRSSRRREISLLGSVPAPRVPPASVPAPDTELLPGLPEDNAVVGGLVLVPEDAVVGGLLLVSVDVLPELAVDDGLLPLAPEALLPGWPPVVLLTLGVSAPLGPAAAGPGAGDALLSVDGGGVLSALDADGTLGSPGLEPGGVAAVVEEPLSAGAVETGLGGVSTPVSLLQAAIDVPMATALTVMRNLRVTIVCSR